MRALHEAWSDRLPALVDFLERQLPAGTTTGQALEAGKLILDVALRFPAKRESIERLEAERLRAAFNSERPSGGLASQTSDVARYSMENQLIRLTEQLQPERTALANTLLRLSGREATKWLLIIETERSTGLHDEWRASRELLRSLVFGITQKFDSENAEFFWPVSSATLKRLHQMGVARALWNEEEGEVWKYEIQSPVGDMVDAILTDEPWRAAVRAALGDETQHIISGGDGTKLSATSDLSRIVTHEVRNALVPVRHHATSLLASITEPAARDRVDRVLLGVNRVLRFAEELVTISEAVTPDRLKTQLGSFLQEAIGPLDGGERVVLRFQEQLLELPREPLSRALRNVVQNALQLAPAASSVEIEVTVSAGQLVVAVLDRGPGVPPADLERVFEDGFTTRTGGSGFGLAMTRRILTELGGSVHCEARPGGGARFVLALPITEPTS